jgi:hypothetical protein
MANRRVDVQEAAGMLGTSVDAVRKRIRRGTLRSEREDGRVYVWVDGDPDAHAPPYREAPNGVQDEVRLVVEGKDAHIAALSERIDSLEKQLDVRAEELRRKDHIIAGLVERVPELEAPKARETAAEDAQGREEGSFAEEPRPERSWWRKWFVFE